jgi:hypothetical protein
VLLQGLAVAGYLALAFVLYLFRLASVAAVRASRINTLYLAMRKPFRTQNSAVTAAFFIAPLLPSIFIPLVGRWRFPPDAMGALPVYVIALPFVFAIGLPLFLLSSKMRIFSWWASILGGVFGGVAIVALVGGRYNLHGAPLWLYVTVGAVTGLAFWVVVMLGPEPDQFAARNWVEAFRPRRV